MRRTNEPPFRDAVTKRNALLALALILLAGAALRIPAVLHGLPYMVKTDDARKIEMALHMFKTLDLDPDYFNKPTFFLYVNAIAYIPYYLGGRAIGAFESRDDLVPPVRQFLGTAYAPMPSVVVLGRLVSVSFGLGTIALLYLAGSRLWSRRSAGLMAAGLLAISPIHRDLDRIHPDAQLIFFLVLSFVGAIGIVQRGRVRDYLLAGVGLGLALSSKYNTSLFVPGILIAHLVRIGGFRAGWWRSGRLWAALASVVATFVVLNPFLFTHLTRFIQVVRWEVANYAVGENVLIMEGEGAQWYLVLLLMIDSPLLLLGFVALVAGFINRDRHSVLAAGFVTTYLIAIVAIATRNQRTLAPALPFLALLGAGLALEIMRRLRSMEGRRSLALAGAAVFAVWSVAQPLFHSVADLRYGLGNPAWKQAAIWIDENLPPGSRIEVEMFSPWIDRERFDVRKTRDILSSPWETYGGAGVNYLAFSDRSLPDPKSGDDDERSRRANLEAIRRDLDLVRMFDDGRSEQYVYRLGGTESRP